MQEVQADPVHLGPALRHRVDPALLRTPVVAVAPVGHQPGDALDHLVVLAGWVAGFAIWHALLRRQPGSSEAPGQVIEDIVGNRDLERPGLGHSQHSKLAGPPDAANPALGYDEASTCGTGDSVRDVMRRRRVLVFVESQRSRESKTRCTSSR